MSEPKVWHLKDPECPKDAVYIGRGSPYGNPYYVGVGMASRELAIKKYAELLKIESFAAHVRANLKGKDLACHCAPFPCHGDLLLEFANKNDF